MKRFMFIVCSWLTGGLAANAQQQPASVREHLLLDTGWRFALGHPHDMRRDFNTGTGYFTYLAKAAYGDGAASASFDDRMWRKLNLPHDWAVELPFSPKGSKSHGYKAIGQSFPENSVGWYRKTFLLNKEDEAKRISIAFDGVYRNFSVWINGFYLGTEPSGYTGVEYNISEYLNYGGENTLAVRVDASMEEGWFYEGAGIYRHVWLKKTAPVHVVNNGTFITSSITDNKALFRLSTTVKNEQFNGAEVVLRHTVKDKAGNIVTVHTERASVLRPWETKEQSTIFSADNPRLWSVDTPYLYTLLTEVMSGEKLADSYTTTFGIRSIRFDADKGFFLNGKALKIQGTNNHQDHAGVGAAIPDALQEYRILRLKEMGVNAYRCSHNPPTPELLDACDRLGMLVIDENRLMGASQYHYEYMKRFMLRDRNHPSVISWSIGNEEWGIEGNQLGAKIASSFQAFVKTIDSSRGITAAISGGWQKGISNVIDIMGVNYVGQINTDEHHRDFPAQPMWGTEEGSTRATRGIYQDVDSLHRIAAYDKRPYPHFKTIEEGWKHYMERDYLAGMFIWTGFDYRGEPTPYEYPSVASYFGMLDLCGFPKDNAWYLKSWWTKDTVLHLLPHWSWKGDEGKLKDVWVYSNCDNVELLLNGKSQGVKKMGKYGHLEWKLAYQPGTLQAFGYMNGKKVAVKNVTTTGIPVTAQLAANRLSIKADGKDVSVITVAVADSKGLRVPDAEHDFSFNISGPGRIIGVGNGNPASLEPDRFVETISTVSLTLAKEKLMETSTGIEAELSANFDDHDWVTAFKEERDSAFGRKDGYIIYRGSFTLPSTDSSTIITYFGKQVGVVQSVYINGTAVVLNMDRKTEVRLDKHLFRTGVNRIAILAKPLLKAQPWDEINTDPGVLQLLTPAPAWKRKLFSGLAQVIVQSAGAKGDILLTAESKGIKPVQLVIKAE